MLNEETQTKTVDTTRTRYLVSRKEGSANGWHADVGIPYQAVLGMRVLSQIAKICPISLDKLATLEKNVPNVCCGSCD